MPDQYDVFISYSTKDAVVAYQVIKRRLEEENYRCYVDVWALEGGQPWEKQLEAAIEYSKLFVLILSPDSVESPYVLNEIKLARVKGKTILPIVIRGKTESFAEDIKLKLLDIAPLQYFSMTDGQEAGLNQFMREVHRRLSSPAPTDAILTLSKVPEPYPIEVTEQIERILEAIASYAANFPLQVCLWMLNKEKNELFSVAAHHLSDTDLKVSFKAEEGGFLSYLWQAQTNLQGLDSAWLPFFGERRLLTDHHVEYWVNEWGIKNKYVVEATSKIHSIAGFPVLDRHGSQLIGFITVDCLIRDKPKESKGLYDEEIFTRITESILQKVVIIRELINTNEFLRYQRYLALVNLCRVARLGPPLPVPVKAAIYRADIDQKYLYMVAKSGEFSSDQLTMRYPYGVGIIGQVWQKGEYLVDSLDGLDDGEKVIYMSDVWNLKNSTINEINIFKEVISMSAFPIFTKNKTDVCGVLAIFSEMPIGASRLIMDKDFFMSLAQVATKILQDIDDTKD